METTKKWAFNLFVIVLILELILFLATLIHNNFQGDKTLLAIILLGLGSISVICIIVGLVLVALCIRGKELKGTKIWTAAIGLPFFLVTTLLLVLM